jgi:single-stranded-DNA-specific exonuclease
VFTLRPGAFDAFRQAFDRACTPRDGAPARPPLVLDAWLQPEAIDPALWTAIRRLEPFGEGNPRPRWGLAGARLDRPPRTVGAGGEHLRLDFAAADRRFPAVWFRRGDLAPSLAPGSRWDLAFELHPNNGFGDEDGLDLHLVDIRPG